VDESVVVTWRWARCSAGKGYLYFLIRCTLTLLSGVERLQCGKSRCDKVDSQTVDVVDSCKVEMLDLFTFREFLAERGQIDVDDDDDDVEEDEMVDVEVYKDRSID